ncbi:YtxH domain-containing protein [Bacillus sp. FJAT-45350]|uniref:YtxH domain-containing protein n=1 Tax=Bacillus sp. FJAT-45350 TaxID=2011014 RepID=UPI000BB873BE|nr:YtxH domain-containing protein [Bacillus sp. FJAT-45350]
MSDMNTKDFLIGSLIGGIVGASAALLMAPKSGKELRHDLNEQAQMAKDKTSEFTNNAYNKGNELATVAKDKSSHWVKIVSDQSSQVVDKVKSVRSGDNGEETESVEEGLTPEVSANSEDPIDSAENAREEIQKLNDSISEQEEIRNT